MALTGCQQRFVLEYVKDGNAAAAARRAGYSPRGARQTGHKFLRNADISAAVREAVQKHFRALDLDLDRIIRELDL